MGLELGVIEKLAVTEFATLWYCLYMWEKDITVTPVW